MSAVVERIVSTPNASSMPASRQCQWTAALLTAIAGNVREQKDHLTITELLGCPRATVWKKTRDYYE